MLKVLIADDERIIRRTIRLIGNWEEYGMEIIGEAENGIAAVQVLREECPDLILLDMKMPGYSGEQVMEIIELEQMDTQVIIISGYEDFQYAKTALKFGAADYILKPIDRNELNEALKKISDALNVREKTVNIQQKKDLAEQIRERIDKEYREEISLSKYAEEYYINKEALSRIFKKKFSIGLAGYINKVRLEQAKVYLLSGYSSTECAEMVGYHDVNYFSRVFKKYFGMSPTKFLEEANNR